MSTRFNVRGVVRDENGSPLSGASVEVHYGAPSTGVASSPPSTCFFLDFCWFNTKTDSSGTYDVVFDARQATVFLMPGIASTIKAMHPSYGANMQIVPFTHTDVVLNFLLRKSPLISAGESTTVTIDSESSRCQDGEDVFVLTSRCAFVDVQMSQPGTLTVDARAQGAGVIPVVYWATSGDYVAPGTRVGTGISLQVNRGFVSALVAVPVGMPTQRIDVTTTFR